MEYAFWNTLHDGSIDAIGGSIPGDITLTVGIEYLCAKLPTAAKSLRLSLLGCSLFEYARYGEDATADLSRIASDEPEVLSAVAHEKYVEVCCAGGTLKVAYRSVELRLMEGQLISQAELEAAADRYWSEWSEGRKKGV
jgi:hypothetical protein